MTRGQRVLWWTLLALGVLLAISASSALWAYERPGGGVPVADRLAAERPAVRGDGGGGGGGPQGAGDGGTGRDVMVIGSDQGASPGGAPSGAVLLVHLSSDGERAEVVSVPGDIVVDLPACQDGNGARHAGRRAPFDRAYQVGGAGCTVRSFERLAGIHVDRHLVVGPEDAPSRARRALDAGETPESPGGLWALAREVRAVPESGLSFHTVPTQPHPGRPGRLLPDRPAADRLFAALREDRPPPGGTPGGTREGSGT